MKRPRVDDFDPSIVPKLGSSMDDLPVIESPKQETAKLSAVSVFAPNEAQPPVRTNDASFVPSNERSNERRKVRHTFDILSDQLLGLREIAIEREKIFGKRALLGELVQEALDLFIAKERYKK